MLSALAHWLGHYVRLSVFFVAALVGLQIPGFKDDYSQALQSALSETNQALAPFKRDAEQFFKGDLSALLAHYQNSDDRVYAKGGDNLQLLMSRNEALNERWQDFADSPYLHLLNNADITVAKRVWQQYNPQIQLSSDSLVSALSIAVILTMLIETLLRIIYGSCRWCGRALIGKHQH